MYMHITKNPEKKNPNQNQPCIACSSAPPEWNREHEHNRELSHYWKAFRYCGDKRITEAGTGWYSQSGPILNPSTKTQIYIKI